MKKRTICLLMAVIMSIGTFTYAAAADATARTVSIFKVEGKDVKMTKGTEKEFAAKAGVKLFGGYTVSTGKDSYAYLKLDEDSLIKMDEKSKIKVNKQTSKKLSVSVLSGGLAVDAATQTDGKSMEIRAGNSALAIRGTYFVAEITPTGTKFTMFEGSGMVGNTEVPHGKMLIITEEEDGTQKQELVDIFVDDDTSAFLLQNILDNAEMLKDSGILTDDDLKKVQDLLDNMPEDTEAAELTGLGATDSGQKYYTTESPRGGGGNSGNKAPTVNFVVTDVSNTPYTVGSSFQSLAAACKAMHDYDDLNYSGSGYYTIDISPVASNGTYEITTTDWDAAADFFTTGVHAEINIKNGVKATLLSGVPLLLTTAVILNNEGEFINNSNYSTSVSGGTVAVKGLTLHGTFNNYYKFTNNGTVNVEIGTFNNGNVFTNNYHVSVDSGGTFNNNNSFTTIGGDARLYIGYDTVNSTIGTFVNVLSFVNGIGSIVDVNGDGALNGVFENSGSFKNDGELNIFGDWFHNSASKINSSGGNVNASIGLSDPPGSPQYNLNGSNPNAFYSSFYRPGANGTAYASGSPAPNGRYYWQTGLGNLNDESGWQQ